MMQVKYHCCISLFLVAVDRGKIIDLILQHKVADWVKLICDASVQNGG